MNHSDSKTFVLGLPRTGTTSLCALMLELGFKTAHTAFTRYSFYEADVVADTPVYCDYRELDRLFPGSRFIYLQRDLDAWLPSISALLLRMLPRLAQHDGFHPVMQRAFTTVFGPITEDSARDFDHLAYCYRRHQESVLSFLEAGDHSSLVLDVTKPESLNLLQSFLGNERLDAVVPHLNRGGKIAQWQKVNHPLKVGSNLSGPGGRLFLDYSELT